MNPEEKNFFLQNLARGNADDLQTFLRDMEHWEKSMREKEREILKSAKDEPLPPVRNSTCLKPKKKIKQRKKEKTDPRSDNSCKRPAADSFSDMNEKWMDKDKSKESSSSASSEEEDERIRQQHQQDAIGKKDRGNEFFKNGDYDAAINCYTAGMQLDPLNALLPANRAMAFLKKEQYQAAENDCSLCLNLDPTYVKALLRRGSAREALGKVDLAKADFERVLAFEPDNKQAKSSLDKLEKEHSTTPQSIEPTNCSTSISESPMTVVGDVPCAFAGATRIPFRNTPDLSPQIPMTRLKVSNVSKVKFATEIMSSKVERVMDVSDASPSAEVLPPVPSAPYQFLSDWMRISKNDCLKYKYLKQLPPEKLSVIFKYSMEAEVFPDLIHVLGTSFLANGDDVFYYLKHLASVGRFSTMLVFLSQKERADLTRLLDHLQTTDHSAEEISEMLELYKL